MRSSLSTAPAPSDSQSEHPHLLHCTLLPCNYVALQSLVRWRPLGSWMPINLRLA